MTAEVLLTQRHGRPMVTYSRRKRQQLSHETIPQAAKVETDKPLRGKAVYLDVCGYRKVTSFKDDIVRLGARVDTFLSRDINFLITNQSRCSPDEKKGDSSDQYRSPSVCSTPSPFNTSAYSNSPTACGDQPTISVSRGKVILQNAHVKSQASVVENAIKWGVKVVYLETALKWVSREIEKSQLKEAAKSTRSCRLKGSRKQDENEPVTIHRLKSPYVKFESTKHKYRPSYREYETWQSINVDTPYGSCPFDGGFVSHDLHKDRGLLNVTLSTTESIAARDTSTKTRVTSVANDSFDLSHVVTKGEAQRINQQRRRAARKKGYCECCHVTYADIDEHVRCSDHKAFVQNETNFLSLARLIDKCPGSDEFLESIPLPVTTRYNKLNVTPTRCRKLSQHSPRRHLSVAPFLTSASRFLKLSPSLQHSTTHNITLDVRTPSKSRHASSPRDSLHRSTTRLTRSFSANFIQTLGPLTTAFTTDRSMDATVARIK